MRIDITQTQREKILSAYRLKTGDVYFNELSEVRRLFNDNEITEMVNRYLNQREYQRTAHKKLQQERRDREAPLKILAKKFFPGVSWINLSKQQLQQLVLTAEGWKEEHESDVL